MLPDGSTKVPDDEPNVYVSKEEDPENWHVQVRIHTTHGLVMSFLIMGFISLLNPCLYFVFSFLDFPIHRLWISQRVSERCSSCRVAGSHFTTLDFG